MYKRNFRLALFGLVIGLIVISCNLYSPTPQDPASALYTEAAETVAVQLTQRAYDNLVAALTQAASGQVATPTVAAPTPGADQPTATLPFFTPTPTQFVAPTLTPAPPTPTPIPVRCNQAAFVRDVTVADGSVFTPGSEFTKVWRLQNTGSCTWDSDYSLVYVSGDRMSGRRAKSFSGSARPGESIDLSLDLLAPAKQGRYTGYWMLESDTGERFGIGKNADTAFWVEIRILEPNANFAYDFASNMCTATWRSSAGSLTCPSPTDSASGSVAFLDRPKLEDGRTENEPTLWTRPQTTRGGWIQGVYPPYKVKENDHFLAEIGCLYGNEGCGVTFSLDYILSDGRIRNLGEWFEAYEGGVYRIDLDLSSLTGKTVQFVLSVTNNDQPSKANAFWFVPSIRKVTPPTPVPPTPTRTPTVTPTPPDTTTDPTPTSPPDTEPLAVNAAVQQLSTDLGVDPSTIRVASVQSVDWPDSCMGVSIPGRACSAVIIPGYKIILTYTDSQYEAHTNQDGSVVFWYTP